jgi:hypothetical protein
LIGIYVGVIPVALGLMFHPFMRGLSRRAMDAILALTIGLLVFLLIDTASEGLQVAQRVPCEIELDGAARDVRVDGLHLPIDARERQTDSHAAGVQLPRDGILETMEELPRKAGRVGEIRREQSARRRHR